jgi:aryl-alcohol dehydrogenase-like predicted oxidoreductase
MLKKTIGTTRQQISAIGVGAGGLGGFDHPDYSHDTDAVTALSLSFARGISFVDTAEVYGGGHSEELVAQAVRGYDVVIATKVSPANLAPQRMRGALERSLRRLGRERVDLYQVHWSNPAIPLAETMGALDELAAEGKIGAVGVCNFSLRELDEARASLRHARLATLQAEYNLFDRSSEKEVLPYCEKHGITFLAYSPLDQGHICGSSVRREALTAIASRYQCSVGTLALAWLIRKAPVVVIPKAASPAHAEQNALAGSLVLSEADAAEIDRLTGMSAAVIPVNAIRVVPVESTDRKVYRTLEEAQANIYNMTPSPAELARQMLAGEFLKPVRVRRVQPPTGGYEYELIEGRIRYWAWVIAFEGKRDIPVLVREK